MRSVGHTTCVLGNKNKPIWKVCRKPMVLLKWSVTVLPGISWLRLESSDDILKHSPKVLNYINDSNFFTR